MCRSFLEKYKLLRRAERCASIRSNSPINPSPLLGHLGIHPVQSILRREMRKIINGFKQNRKKTYCSTSCPPAHDPDQFVLFCKAVLHSEWASTIPTTGALACSAGTHHVAWDLVFVSPIRHGDTTPLGGLVVGRGAGRSFTDGVRHDGHLNLLQNWTELWRTRGSVTPTCKLR